MIKSSMVKEYLRYILPSMLAFTLAGIYSIVDGVFVGNVVGDAGLAGINIAFPLVAFVMAVGTGIGMGGAVISSIEEAKGNVARSKRIIGITFSMLVVVSIPITAVLLLVPEQLCYVLGGRGETLAQAVEYTSMVAWGAPFQIITMGSLPLIRNRGSVGYAMVVSIIAGTMNAVLDYVFVVELLWGTSGAAAATALSQVLSFALCVVFFARKKQRISLTSFGFELKPVMHIVGLGLAPFGLTLLPEATVVAININAEMYGGQTAVAAYAVISYVACIIQMLIQGVSDGSQPLISKNYGAKNYAQVKALRNTNYVIAIGIGVLGLVGMYAASSYVPMLFGASEETSGIISYALPVFSVAFIFYGFTHPSTSYFYAIDNSKASNMIVYGEAILIVLTVFGAGWFFGMEGIWRSVTVVQAILSALTGVLLYVSRKKVAIAAMKTSKKNALSPQYSAQEK